MLVRTYVKRHLMEASLRQSEAMAMPPGILLTPWDDELLEAHAEVKWLSFRETVDAAIFPNLGCLDGCLRMMRTIASHEGFVRGATWLARGLSGYCGCIQGVRTGPRTGTIQNLAVLDDCRGRGIGRALLAAAMAGFRDAKLAYAQLEVSVRNTHALRLYQSAGFRKRKTVYREMRTECAEYAI
jgi:hypothetical protein